MTKRTLMVTLFVLLCARGIVSYARGDINEDLYSAVNKNDVQAVKDLLSKGANPNAKCKNWAGKQDFTPLYAAAESGYAEIIKILLDAGGDVNAKCPMDKTPLMV
ncbi:MAG: ankyrin repeat domain-containing protein, partial [Acidobacteriota bacterium]